MGDRLRAKSRPLPRRSQENDIGRLPLVRNRALSRPEAAAGPVLDGEVRAAMTTAGLRLGRLLRATGHHRDAPAVLRMSFDERAGTDRDTTFALQLELFELLADADRAMEAIEVLEQAFHRTRDTTGPEAGNYAQACEVLKHAWDLPSKRRRSSTSSVGSGTSTSVGPPVLSCRVLCRVGRRWR
ncbi:hypothetical protein STBA_24840 [Streptomyces sp. MP131-18]|nr:hypothetical protein STBA_24840 [Streptomyces sp. MP131-18]